MAKVLLEKIYKTYKGDKGREVIAVEDVNLAIEDKEFLVLVGPSGCGKSTTLRMLAGLEEITRGNIFIEDRRVNDVPPKDRDIAMVFQNYALYPHMTVYQNMAFGLELRKFPKQEIKQRVKEAAQILGLSDEMLERKPKALSGGQRQRVAVGRAIVRKPKAFLFDEPLSNLDAKMRVQMRMEISRLHQRLETTMIYVTHDQVEAMTMGDRIVVMSNGRIQQVAKPLEIYNHPSNLFVAGFIGSPPMNFIEGRIITNGSNLAFQELSEKGDPGTILLNVTETQSKKLTGKVGQRVVMGVRFEDLGDKYSMPSHDPSHVIHGKLDVIEPMGVETHLYIFTGNHNLIARSTTHIQPELGHDLQININMEKAHFFDSLDKSKHKREAMGDIDQEAWQVACQRIA